MIKLVRAISVALLLIVAYRAVADENRKLPTIGLAIPVDPATDAPLQKAFREGLRALGYVDGVNVTLIVRYSNGDPAKYRALIQELIGMHVDVLWGEARELKEATTTIPIVSPRIDAEDTGLVESLARPGGNLTGVSFQRYDIHLKNLELTKELLPTLKRLCFLLDDRDDGAVVNYVNNVLRPRASDMGVSVCRIPVRTLDDIQALPKVIDKERPQAIVFWTTPFTYQHRDALISSLALRLPVIADGRQLAELGAVLTYSANWLEVFRRSATYVDKILKGAKPANLPIEQPTQFSLVLNLKAAKALGIKVPQSMMLRADEIIR